MEPGSYVAKLERIESTSITTTEGVKPRYRWHFTIAGAGANGADAPMSGWTGVDFTPKAKVNDWYQAFTGRRLGRGDKGSPSDLYGKSVLLTLTLDESTGFNKIAAVAPVPKSMNQAEPVATPVDPEYAAWLAARETKRAAVAAANSEEPPAPAEPPGDLPDDDLLTR